MFNVVTVFDKEQKRPIIVYSAREENGITYFLFCYQDKWYWDNSDGYMPII